MSNDDESAAEEQYHQIEEQHVAASMDFSSEAFSENPDLVHKLSKHQLVYSICGLVLGLSTIVGGVALLLNGVMGSTNWTANILGANSNLTDAPAGVVLFVVGIFIVFLTRYKIKVK